LEDHPQGQLDLPPPRQEQPRRQQPVMRTQPRRVTQFTQPPRQQQPRRQQRAVRTQPRQVDTTTSIDVEDFGIRRHGQRQRSVSRIPAPESFVDPIKIPDIWVDPMRIPDDWVRPDDFEDLLSQFSPLTTTTPKRTVSRHPPRTRTRGSTKTRRGPTTTTLEGSSSTHRRGKSLVVLPQNFLAERYPYIPKKEGLPGSWLYMPIILAALNNNKINPPPWGNWIFEQFYADGKRLTWDSVVKYYKDIFRKEAINWDYYALHEDTTWHLPAGIQMKLLFETPTSHHTHVNKAVGSVGIFAYKRLDVEDYQRGGTIKKPQRTTRTSPKTPKTLKTSITRDDIKKYWTIVSKIFSEYLTKIKHNVPGISNKEFVRRMVMWVDHQHVLKTTNDPVPQELTELAYDHVMNSLKGRSGTKKKMQKEKEKVVDTFFHEGDETQGSSSSSPNVKTPSRLLELQDEKIRRERVELQRMRLETDQLRKETEALEQELALDDQKSSSDVSDETFDMIFPPPSDPATLDLLLDLSGPPPPAKGSPDSSPSPISDDTFAILWGEFRGPSSSQETPEERVKKITIRELVKTYEQKANQNNSAVLERAIQVLLKYYHDTTVINDSTIKDYVVRTAYIYAGYEIDAEAGLARKTEFGKATLRNTSTFDWGRFTFKNMLMIYSQLRSAYLVPITWIDIFARYIMGQNYHHHMNYKTAYFPVMNAEFISSEFRGLRRQLRHIYVQDETYVENIIEQQQEEGGVDDSEDEDSIISLYYKAHQLNQIKFEDPVVEDLGAVVWTDFMFKFPQYRTADILNIFNPTTVIFQRLFGLPYTAHIHEYLLSLNIPEELHNLIVRVMQFIQIGVFSPERHEYAHIPGSFYYAHALIDLTGAEEAILTLALRWIFGAWSQFATHTEYRETVETTLTFLAQEVAILPTSSTEAIQALRKLRDEGRLAVVELEEERLIFRQQAALDHAEQRESEQGRLDEDMMPGITAERDKVIRDARIQELEDQIADEELLQRLAEEHAKLDDELSEEAKLQVKWELEVEEEDRQQAEEDQLRKAKEDIEWEIQQKEDQQLEEEIPTTESSSYSSADDDYWLKQIPTTDESSSSSDNRAQRTAETERLIRESRRLAATTEPEEGEEEDDSDDDDEEQIVVTTGPDGFPTVEDLDETTNASEVSWDSDEDWDE